MMLIVNRTDKNAERTIGLLYIDSQWVGYVLEDPVRKGDKIAGKTAIPAGVYKVSITYSPKFGKALPYIHDVPGFEGIRIHAGNDADDTEGCLLVGLNRTSNKVIESNLMMNFLQPKIQAAQDRGETIFLHIG